MNGWLLSAGRGSAEQALATALTWLTRRHAPLQLDAAARVSWEGLSTCLGAPSYILPDVAGCECRAPRDAGAPGAWLRDAQEWTRLRAGMRARVDGHV